MSLKSNFALMAEYNQSMNNNIYQACSTLSASELAENRGAFFGSILGTLNHILVGDVIWLKRFISHPSQIESLDYIHNFPSPQALDSMLYPDFAELREVRAKMDSTIQEFVDQLTDKALVSTLTYRNTKGLLFTKNFGHLIQHFFNHQTHHRGQVSTLLNQAGVDIGMTDLLMSIPNE